MKIQGSESCVSRFIIRVKSLLAGELSLTNCIGSTWHTRRFGSAYLEAKLILVSGSICAHANY